MRRKRKDNRPDPDERWLVVSLRALLARVLGPVMPFGLALLAGCGSNTLTPTPRGLLVDRVELVGVTVPVGAVAGEPTPVLVHWLARNCSENFLEFDVTEDTDGTLVLTPLGVRPADGGSCPQDGRTCFTTANIYVIAAPANGSRLIQVQGEDDTLIVRLDTNSGAPAPGHIIEMVNRNGGAPSAGIEFDYMPGGSYSASMYDTLATGRTDSSGRAVTMVPCGPPEQFTWLVVPDRWGACGVLDALAFADSMALCGRALRTKMLYGARETSAPATATGNVSSSATYSAGSPWWRAPVRIASR